ncbi:1-deoxy-D-xylulose 5-phosphate reductoisomerase [Planomonospora parontospora subsp. parontospora]|uniref:1-deoxy-D-xylulose 5-phosphate reductoisomerase n=2 Tax=Planomonospora parontospora TaxID=58119 RepID=A0AA37BIG5_9ACTN|nr:1-deoxy-D-xylulose-5-phosphate reductoisomerase [Planomonospora parontospora]GGK73504.1 1-deoxy-D-xylulose 5-phosphate reductoisomerase [Planomonospora parontospora]GII09403.1 1-deoxy-D-xylulose 5-phosphate reductoisomerase [Planomonospora parontospora subsp. parontospora]
MQTDITRSVVLLGSTGSIGTQSLDVIARNPGRFRVAALAAGGGRIDLLARQAAEFRPEAVAVADPAALPALKEALAARGVTATVLAGPEGVAEAAAWPCDTVLNGITGALGLTSTLAALEAGRTLALANKESLIIGGPLVKRLAKPGQLLPVDSEHAALAQCLWAAGPTGPDASAVRKLVVTASGGPFRGRSRAELGGVTPEQALAHPTWSMGPVITVNSATLVNKGLEVIEAHLLFDVGFDRIDVVVHPQSVVHSMVEFVDGSVIAQASPPDMRLPIALALGWPERVAGAAPAVDWTRAHTWTFEPLDDEAFPAVALARHVGSAGGTAPAVYNAANEVCVEAFLGGRLPFPGILDTVAAVVAEHVPGEAGSVEEVLAADGWARIRARELTATA